MRMSDMFRKSVPSAYVRAQINRRWSGFKVILSLLICTALLRVYLRKAEFRKNFDVTVKSGDHCLHILTNLTRGRWVKRITRLNPAEKEYQGLMALERRVDEEMELVRIEKGMNPKALRNDSRCGYKNLQTKPPVSGYLRGSWCDPESANPCCSDEDDGICRPNAAEFCDCPRCVDMRKILHADIADWMPSDRRCRRRNYTGFEACRVMSRFKEIHFTGDSMLRKLFEALIMTMKSDPERGVWLKSYSEPLKHKCVGNRHFFHRECNYPEKTFRLSDLMTTHNLCEGEMNVTFNSAFTSFTQKRQTVSSLLRTLAGKQNSILIFCFGAHFNCNADLVIREILSPAFEDLERFRAGNKNNTRSLPRLLFIPPDPPGIFKPSVKISVQGRKPNRIYSEKISQFCQEHGVPVLDFNDLTMGVHSYDGTHYGRAVNLMKVQILLNYLDTLD